jgi:fibronectin-binding autotransporter adhesin
MSRIRHGQPRPRRPRVPAILVAAFAAVVSVGPPASAETFTVHCPGQSLQARLNSAPAGSTILISGTCVGPFVVTNKSLTLKGSPHATLDGNQRGSTLTITGAPTVHLMGLTITRGLNDLGIGGGINASKGTLTLDHVVVQDDYAIAQSSKGGGIFMADGVLHITSSSIVHDVTLSQSTSNASASGGGVEMETGSLTISHSTIARDEAICHATAGTCQAIGAGIDHMGGPTHISASHVDSNRAVATGDSADVIIAGLSGSSLTLSHSTVADNVGVATSDGAGGAGTGIAAGVGGGGSATISGSIVRDNRLTVQANGSGGTVLVQDGGVVYAGDLTVTSSRITSNVLSASGTGKVDAFGGGLASDGRLTVSGSTVSSNVVNSHSTTGPVTAGDGGIIGVTEPSLTVLGSTIAGNHVTATAGADDAIAHAGGVQGSTTKFVMKGSTISGNTVDATAPSGHTAIAHAAGLELGGASAHDQIVNSTIANNAVRGHGPSFFAAGGGMESTAGTVTVTDVTIARNAAGERGGGLLVGGGTTTIEATILALNTAPPGGGPDCRGTIHSAGHNLVGVGAGCNFLGQVSDKANPHPKLGLLQHNGGPTATIAVLAGSPALNAIPKAACAVHVDQRGVPRPQPQNGNCDIGAYERRP